MGVSIDKGILGEARSIPKWKVYLAIVSGLGILLLCASLFQDIRLYTGPSPDLSAKVWMLDVDVERSIFTWISVLSLFSAALLLSMAGDDAFLRLDRFRWHWYFLALVFLFLSFDEFGGVHEKISSFLSSRMHSTGLMHFAWAAPAGIISLLGLIAFIPFIRSLAPKIAILFVVSAAIFICGAVVFEMIGGSVAEVEGVETLRYRILANIEEGLELAGVLIFIYGLLSHLEKPSVADRMS